MTIEFIAGSGSKESFIKRDIGQQAALNILKWFSEVDFVRLKVEGKEEKCFPDAQAAHRWLEVW